MDSTSQVVIHTQVLNNLGIFMTKRTRLIECDSCTFEGKLYYTEGDFSPSDISYCPACGSDISEIYNVSEDEMGEE